MACKDRYIAESEKQCTDEVWIINLRRQLLMTRMDCSRKCNRDDFEFSVPRRNPKLFTIVTGWKCSSVWAFSGSHTFVYYPEIVKKTLTRTIYMEKVIGTPLAVFLVSRTCSKRTRCGTSLTN